MLIVATMTVRTSETATFRDFETRAAAIMARHGGAIERTVVEPPAADGVTFREVHLVRFPEAAAFAAYRADPALASLTELRARAVLATDLLIGEDGPCYGANPS